LSCRFWAWPPMRHLGIYDGQKKGQNYQKGLHFTCNAHCKKKKKEREREREKRISTAEIIENIF